MTTKYFLVLLFSLTTLSPLYSQTFTFVRTSPEYVHIEPDSFEVHSYAQINNLLSNHDTLRLVRISNNLPAQFEAGICDILFCYSTTEDTAIAPYPPGVSTIYIYFYKPVGLTGTGTTTWRAERKSNPSQFITQVFGVTTEPIGIKQISSVVKDFSLSQNYPNPFNPITKIEFSIPKTEYVTLKIYDIVGREVKILVNQYLNQGEYEYEFNAKNLSSGMYYYSLSTAENVAVKKMVLVK
jgi:hypothetical protein